MTFDEAGAVVRRMVQSGRRFSEILEYLRANESFTLRPFSLLHVLQVGVGMRLPESQHILEVFERDMSLRVSVEELDRHADEVLARYRTP